MDVSCCSPQRAAVRKLYSIHSHPAWDWLLLHIWGCQGDTGSPSGTRLTPEVKQDIRYSSSKVISPTWRISLWMKSCSSPLWRRGSRRQKPSTSSQVFLSWVESSSLCQTPALAVSWRPLASPSFGVPISFYTLRLIWRMRRLKRCPETMRGMLLHASSHKPIRSCPPPPPLPFPSLPSPPFFLSHSASQEPPSLTSSLSGLSFPFKYHFLYLFCDYEVKPQVIPQSLSQPVPVVTIYM